jgi:hypothetical protein
VSPVIDAADRGETMVDTSSASRAAISAEMDGARAEFHRLLAHASDAELARRTNGTRWTNEQLLFHMLFGYLIVRNLRVVVKVYGDSLCRWAARAPGY